MTTVASSFAVLILRQRLERGLGVEMPSLGITLWRYSVEYTGWHPPYRRGWRIGPWRP